MYILISHALCNASHSCDIQLYSLLLCSIIVTLFVVNCSLIIISTIGVNISIKKCAALLQYLGGVFLFLFISYALCDIIILAIFSCIVQCSIIVALFILCSLVIILCSLVIICTIIVKKCDALLEYLFFFLRQHSRTDLHLADKMV